MTKGMRSNQPFSLVNEDLATLPPKPMGLNPPLSHIKDDASLSPVPAPFSDCLPPPRTGSRTPSSGSNSSLSTSPSSFLASPIDSPFHLLHSSSAVPFSWERQPGIPKLPVAAAAAGGRYDEDRHLLPLPPPLRSAVGFSRNKRSGAGGFDPFAVALAQCAKESSPETGEDLEGFWWRRSGLKRVGIWRRATISDRIGLISFYGSCKATCSVSDATIVLPRAAGRGAGLYGQMNRRRV
ncbi:hypothetical protein M5K25_012770 [Dendrobium thyrsiflorum]|uniref:Uncharacterized protein n=1 Tax=Dendrobium thyrsiflorum TaxID=117978 RepID=A0ABD0UYP2_DENTH